MITLKIPYKTSSENSFLIKEWRRQFSIIVRFSYNRIKDKFKQKEIRSEIKKLKICSETFNGWLSQCAIMEGISIYKLNKDKKVIFGGKKNFDKRIIGKLSKEQLKDLRLNNLISQGQALYYGNRLFNFKELYSNKLIFKASRNLHLILELQKMSKNIQRKLKQIQNLSILKETPITVSLNDKYIYITYEEPKIEFKPIKNRSLAIDLNPSYIGLSIKENDKILYLQEFDLSILINNIENNHLNLCDIKSKYLNNKHNFELIQISKEIEKLIKYYKINFVFIENLDNILKNKNKGNKFNRKIFNLWKRNRFISNLEKRCNLLNIKLFKIYPHYSSFIGNISKKGFYHDSVNASLEINRRGKEIIINKTKKFYPELTIDSLKDQWKEYLSDDVKDWKKLYQKMSKLMYRVSLEECEKHISKVFKMNSNKSCIKCYNFI